MSEDRKKIRVLLANDLTQIEKGALHRLQSMPEYKVLVKLLNSSCAAANDDVIKTDPEAPNYNSILTFRQQRARSFSEQADTLFHSIKEHAASIIKQEKKEDTEAEDRVAKVFGIHTVKPKPKQQ